MTSEEPLPTVAVIGMSGRFPGAANLEAFWKNLAEGVESISHFSELELEPARLETPGIRTLPNYVRARGVLEGAQLFDAAFFGITPKEAAILDPQHRLFLEEAWASLEDAGYDPEAYAGSIGVWAGMGNATYYQENVLPRRDIVDQFGPFQAMLANEKDFLATRASYKLNLRGPSVNVYTGCSTSLVAVCQAYQALIDFQCDLALAGGVNIACPQRRGYLYQEGAIGSPDGHCRPFDAKGAGTVFSDGIGVVVLKRLEEALSDGDFVYAVIRGAALNNDGSGKVSFTAPSIAGQAEVIAMAQAVGEVEPESISYLEAHGTATPLGDPIEVAALTEAFRARTSKKQFCALGSVKSNIGHLDAAAGIAGFIKTALALHHRQLPPSLNYSTPNPKIDFAASPFFVNTKHQPWPSGSTPRRAGVSSFGIGGTNAHVVLQEAPEVEPTLASRPEQLIVISARTASALDAACARLASHLRARPDLNLADVAHTLQSGRRGFKFRRAVVGSTALGAADALESGPEHPPISGQAAGCSPKVAFLFPGQGAQYVGMAEELYRKEAVFAQQFDACCEQLKPILDVDIRELVFVGSQFEQVAEQRLTETAIAQPVLFSLQYALAHQWMSWGIQPQAMIGHSLGEYVAACLAGVFTLPEALTVIAARGRLMQEQPRGSMMAVRLPLAELQPHLQSEVVVAGLNAPQLNVVSGPTASIEDLQARLSAKAIQCRLLATSHAFHSPMMDGALEPFRQVLQSTSLRQPERAWISCVTGDWVDPEQVAAPEYWVQQLRQPVRFSEGVQRLLDEPWALLEVGPGHALSSLVRLHPGRPQRQAIAISLDRKAGGEVVALLQALGTLWGAGVDLDWSKLRSSEARKRVPLPTYPFERKRFWIEPANVDQTSQISSRDDWGRTEQDQADSSQSASAALIEEGAIMRRVRSLLSDASGLPPAQIDITQSFIESGFDSLLLTQVSTSIEKAFDVRITFRQLMEEHPTPAVLVRHLEARLAGQGRSTSELATDGNSAAEPPADASAPAVREVRIGRDIHGTPAWFVASAELPGRFRQCLPEPPDGTHWGADFNPFAEPLPLNQAPLSEAQQEIWAVVQMGEQASCAYNQCFVLKLRGRVSLDALRAAVQRVFDRHDALRSTFDAQTGAQTFHPPSPLEPPVVDLSELEPEARALRLQALLDDEVSVPLDLIDGPAARVTLVLESSEATWLVLTAHHIVCDGWASWLFFRDLAALYAAERSNTAHSLPQAIAFISHLQREASSEGRARAASSLRYWQTQFADSCPSLDLPVDRLRPAVKGYHGARANRILTKVFSEDVNAAAGRLGATSVGLLLAAFQALLFRLTGQSDLVVGVPLSARRPETREGLAGHVTHLLPMRARMDPQMPFAELVRATRRALLDGQEHQDLTFGTLVRTLKLPRDNSRSALVSAVFNVDRSRAIPAYAGADAEISVVPRRFVNFEIELQLVDTRHELQLELAYNTDLFTAETVQRWLGHYEQLLAGALSNPDMALNQLPLLTDLDRETLAVMNRTEAEYPRSVPLARLIEEAVSRHGPVSAVVCGAESLSYADLNSLANQLAHQLRSRGATRDRLVGVLVERSSNMIVSLLAVMKSGAAYVPLDPSLPRDRLAYMVQDSGVGIVLTQESLRENLPDSAAAIVSLDDASWRMNSTENPAATSHPDDLAYVIYTSGSTGKPKGVAVSRGALMNLLWSMRTWLELSTEDIVLGVTTISFDIAGVDIWLTLLVGARLVLASHDEAVDGTQLRQLMERHRITFLQATPATWRLLLQAQWRGGSHVQIACGGEAMPADLAAALTPLARRVWNFYGPTETTIWSTGYWVQDSTLPILIGRPLANTQCYVLDERQMLLPAGVTGELFIAGDGLARGYLNRPEMTDERFVPNPFAGAPGARMYRTGDLARYRADGNLVCLGRTDHQVKIRGFRIELGEIESVLAECAAVRQCVVVPWEEKPGEVYLLAYVVSSHEDLDPHALRAHLKRSLPDYMIPQLFVPLARLPLTPSGKVDKRALPAPTDLGSSAAIVEAPRDWRERGLVEIWKLVLNLSSIDVTTSFFDIGGHSLLAVPIINAMHQQYGVRLPLATFFQYPTVRLLAEKLRELSDGSDSAGEKSNWTTVVAMKPTGALPPLYCVAGLGGDPMNLRHLTSALGADQPFYGLQHRGVDGILSPHLSIPAMAAESISDIKAIQPVGPYYLCGYSMGGLVAYEMAHQLIETGDTVAGVILLDTFNPQVTSWTVQQRIRAHFQNLFQEGPRYLAIRGVAALHRVVESVRERRRVERAKIGDFEERFTLVTHMAMEAERAYTPPALSAHVALVKTIAELPPSLGIGYPRHESNGWRPLVRGPFDIHPVNSQHLEMTAERVAPTTAAAIDLALAAFRRSLREARIGLG